MGADNTDPEGAIRNFYQKINNASGKKTENPEPEETVFNWIMKKRGNELSISTTDIVDHTVYLIQILRMEENRFCAAGCTNL